jgi:serine/threonine protein kinase
MNHIVIGQEIGRGSFGQVYEAYDEKVGKKVAIKREIRRRGEHPNIIREASIVKALSKKRGFPEFFGFYKT